MFRHVAYNMDISPNQHRSFVTHVPEREMSTIQAGSMIPTSSLRTKALAAVLLTLICGWTIRDLDRSIFRFAKDSYPKGAGFKLDKYSSDINIFT